MAETMLEPAAAATIPPGHYGRDDTTGLRVRIVSGRVLVQVTARGRTVDALKETVTSKYAVALPDNPVIAQGPRVSFLWSGYRTWMAMAKEDVTPDLEAVLRDDLALLASISDQSDGRFIVELSGAKARDTLAKLAPVDLHPRAFRPNDTAMTLFGHVAGQMTQTDATPAYEVMVFRGFGQSFLHDIMAAGAEFGIDVS